MKKSPLEILDVYRERVNSRLEYYLTSIFSGGSYQSKLKDVMSYSVLAGGKRFRPILTYTVADMYGVDISNHHESKNKYELIL